MKPLSLVNRVRALHTNKRNGYRPGDCHCDECCDTIDAIRDAQARSIKPTRPVEIVTQATCDAMADAVQNLRRLGWPAEVSIVRAEPHEDHFFVVRAEIKIGSPCSIPQEARDA